MASKKNKHNQIQEVLKVIRSFKGKPFNSKQLKSALEKIDIEFKEVEMLLEQMVAMQDIAQVSQGRFQAIVKTDAVEGILDLNARGNGYVIPNDGTPDIFIHRKNLNTALHNDRVMVNVFKTRNSEKPEGEITEVIERAKSRITGILEMRNGFALVIPDDKRIYIPLVLDPDQIKNVQHGDKIVVSILQWKPGQESPDLKLDQVLGKPGVHETEMNAIVLEYGFDTSFPEPVEKEASKIKFSIDRDELSKRKDFRGITTFTIDPEDAKDFDDALSFKKLGNDRYEIGVHIADVTHYMPEGGVLDIEAYNRATSVYLVDRTIPMLPEVLSNGVCSLRPNEDKLTFSAVFEMDGSGRIYKEWFGKTIIHSTRRFSYEQAQEVLETGQGDLAEELILMNEMAKQLKEQRFKKGAINFETEEVKFKLDADGTPLNIYIKIRKDAHKLIEEFMLLANRQVAAFIAQKKPQPVFVYRIHDEPSPERIIVFNKVAKRFGYSIDGQNPKTLARSYNKITEQSEGKPEQHIIQQMAIRTMAKAIYTTQKTGHYGLAFEHYTHFTSPIRRYPDVMVHRLLFHYLNGGKSADQSAFEQRCKHSTQREIQAAEAERASVKYKQVEFLKSRVGDIFEGVISGVTEWGIYVEIIENKCEGMVRLMDIPGDYYLFDEKFHCVIGKRKKKKFEMGQTVRVQVIKADMGKRQLDFRMLV